MTLTAGRLLALATTLALAPPASAARPGTYRGKTSQGHGIVLQAGRAWFSDLRTTVRDQCDTHGVVNGPDHIKVRGDGRFHLVARSQVLRFVVSGRFHGRRVTGTLSERRVMDDGTVCRTGTIRFAARLRR